ncbi:DUF4395 domain-containing protein [Alicyclobacillus sp. SO9]|uniref:DUF4395 domain-containing protein n=1 Tax=Alicyclobacillus sp. SO9 TaxID=2665646 RepID=UPI0018E8067C|nr:DUF4395 domain-containing protein [Alicyclobacillus sp. SO9]QQE77202.1 DUF4395 domain-containing protein [Alicyclobacillus sp. SO9]
MMKTASIPRPLVRTNQWTIVLTVVFSLTLHVYWVLFIPLLAGLMGLVFHFNPIMRGAKLFLRKAPSDYVPEDAQQQQFNQYIALSCLFLSLLGFTFHWIIVGYTFAILVALAAFVAILGFCVGCFIRFQWSQYRYRRQARAQQG